MATEYMTIAEAATYLGVSDITVKRYVRENLIPSEKGEEGLRLSTAAVEQYKKINEKFARR